MNYSGHRLRQMLAAEYVLGSLHGAARRRFERLLAGDEGLRAEVVFWEQRLGQMALRLPPIEPREIVWIELQRRMEKRKPAPVAPPPPTRGSLNFWRVMTGLATAASLVLAVLLYVEMQKPPIELPPRIVRVEVPVPQAPPMTYTSMLRPDTMQPKWALSVLPREGRMRVRVLGDSPAGEQQDCQLWVVAGGKPVPVGVLPRSGEASMDWPADVPFSEEIILAVSVEPLGGSTTGAPTGPVIAAAPVVRAL